MTLDERPEQLRMESGSERLDAEHAEIALLRRQHHQAEAARVAEVELHPALEPHDDVHVRQVGGRLADAEAPAHAEVHHPAQPVADVEECYQTTLACILANLSMKLGRELKWDAKRGKVIGDDEANTHLRGPYREPPRTNARRGEVRP